MITVAGFGTRLFVKAPRPGDSEVTFLIFARSPSSLIKDIQTEPLCVGV